MRKNQRESRTLKHNQRLVPKNESQKNLIRTIVENDITLCYGPAGCGKTFVSIALAIEHLIDYKIEKIVVTRPIVEAGENLGALPGDYMEKVMPHVQPIFDVFHHFLSSSDVVGMLNSKMIEILPLAYMRGRTLSNCFVIGDELANATFEQMKMLLTRIGQNAKMILNGDLEQSDLPKHKQGGFEYCIDNLDAIPGIGILEFKSHEIVRHSIIGTILKRLSSHE